MPSDHMPKVDLAKDSDKINKFQLDLMKKVERQNLERAQKLRKVRARSRGTLFAGLAAVIGIYTYTLVAVKQETFLDDFNVPESIPLDPYTHKDQL